MTNQKIIYTKVDEAPALATYSLFPIIETFLTKINISLELKDISLSSRILAYLSAYLPDKQHVENHLEELRELVQQHDSVIIKLPNISASVPQLKAAIKELQEKGYVLPDFPEDPKTEREIEILNCYKQVLGSAVNPVLREGNSDRRAPKAVKNYAKKNPHSMGEWNKDSKTHVATMKTGDFRHNEVSVTLEKEAVVSIDFLAESGQNKALKSNINLAKGDIIDTTFMNSTLLRDFIKNEVEDAKNQDILFSLHMKATMMKVSDPIIFGHVVEVFFEDVFEKYTEEFKALKINPNNGLRDLFNALERLPDDKRDQIKRDFQEKLNLGPELAMVNSDEGITNLHVPSDVIIDASMPAMIRQGGKMWGADGQLKDTKAVIPDSSYAGIYQATIEDCIHNGALDPTTMGTVPNVGLMAQKAEEYGSHDKTFLIPENGVVTVVDEKGTVITTHHVAKGDIWRMCQTKDAAVKDWVRLAVERAKQSYTPALFWLDKDRPHDNELIKKVTLYLKDHDITDLDISILSPTDATKVSLKRMRAGLDTISVTGNVLRDYNTDLFPILELGTSAKMLSIVPLMNGGGLFETGAGGSAPKHVEQFLKENHLRWDSLGEFLALAAALDHIANKTGNTKAAILSKTLDQATELYLIEDKSPQRKVGQLDNRGSHFYLALFWAKCLSEQKEDLGLANEFKFLYDALCQNQSIILNELNSVQGAPVNIGGYYAPDKLLVKTAMSSSKVLNRIVNN